MTPGSPPLPAPSPRPLSARLLWLVRVVGLGLVLIAYWAPWVAHPSAGLAIAEIDFNEFPKFMPQVRSGELEVWREAFYLTLLGPALALAVWAAGHQATSARATLRLAALRAMLARSLRAVNLGRWLLRLFALGLTVTPSIFNVFEPGEFATQLRIFEIVAALILLSPLIRRLPPRLVALLLIAWFVAVAVLPAREFLNLVPALAAIYHEPINFGWGFYAALAGFALLALAECYAAVARTPSVDALL